MSSSKPAGAYHLLSKPSSLSGGPGSSSLAHTTSPGAAKTLVDDLVTRLTKSLPHAARSIKATEEATGFSPEFFALAVSTSEAAALVSLAKASVLEPVVSALTSSLLKLPGPPTPNSTPSSTATTLAALVAAQAPPAALTPSAAYSSFSHVKSVSATPFPSLYPTPSSVPPVATSQNDITSLKSIKSAAVLLAILADVLAAFKEAGWPMPTSTTSVTGPAAPPPPARKSPAKGPSKKEGAASLLRLSSTRSAASNSPTEQLSVSEAIFNTVTNILFGPLSKARSTAGPWGVLVEQQGLRVLHHLSALDWETVFDPIRAQITTLSVTTDDSADTSLLSLIAALHLTKGRLEELLSTLTNAASSFKRSGRLALASALRPALWRWIDANPNDFSQVLQGSLKLSGRPDLLFDTVDAWTDGKRRNANWPLEAALLLLTPDALLTASSGEGDPSDPKTIFLDNLKKALKGKGATDTAMICYADFLRAATYVSSSGVSPLRHLLPLIGPELRGKLFNPRTPTKTPIADANATAACRISLIVSEYRLNPNNTLKNTIDPCTAPTAPPEWRAAAAAALRTLAEQGQFLEWTPTLTDVLPSAHVFREMLRSCLALKRSELIAASSGTGPASFIISRAASDALDAVVKSDPASGAATALSSPPITLNVPTAKSGSTPSGSFRRRAGTGDNTGTLTGSASAAVTATITDLLHLFRLEPRLALAGGQATRSASNSNRHQLIPFFRDLIDAIALWTPDGPVGTIPTVAAEATLSLHRREFIDLWTPGDPVSGFWFLHTVLMARIADFLIGPKQRLSVPVPANKLRAILNVLRDCLEARNAYMAQNDWFRPVPKSAAPAREASYGMLEVALLLSLCNGTGSIVSLAATCLGLLCDEADIVGRSTGSQPSLTQNYAMYRSLSTAGLLVTGKAAQQRAIRAALRHVTVPSPAIVQAWNWAYSRFTAGVPAAVSPGVLPFGDPSSAEAAADTSFGAALGQALGITTKKANAVVNSFEYRHADQEWENYAGFLASLASVGLSRPSLVSAVAPETGFKVPSLPAGSGASSVGRAKSSARSASKKSSSNPSSANHSRNPSVDDVAVPKGFSSVSHAILVEALEGKSSRSMGDSLTVGLMELTVAPNPFVRDSLVTVLGLALAPELYVNLFAYMLSRVRRAFGDAGDVRVDAETTRFIDQCLTVVRLILDQNLEEVATAIALVVEIETLFISIAQYLSQSLHTSSTAVHIKIKFCRLTAQLLAKRDYVSFRSEIKFRNTLTSLLLEWFSDFVFGAEATATKGTHRDSSIPAIMSARSGSPASSIAGIVGASDGMTSEATSGNENELAQAYQALDGDCILTVSKLLLDLPLQPDEERMAEANAKFRMFVHHFSSLENILRRARRTKAGSASSQLIKLTIQALGFMLKANVDVGLQHFIKACYSADDQTRSAFLTVLTNLLKTGAEFGALEALQDKYSKLVGLLMSPDLVVMDALADCVPANELDDVAAPLVRVFDSADMSHTIISAVVSNEIDETDNKDTLFRRNSMASKLLSAYARLVAGEYLRDTLRASIASLCANPTSVQLDPERFDSVDENVDENAKNLLAAVSSVTEALFSAAPQFPEPLRAIYASMERKVQARWPAETASMVGPFIFLRLINPILVSPTEFGVIPDQPSPLARRQLISVSRVLQNAANGLPFTARDAASGPINKFLDEHRADFDKYLKHLVTAPTPAPGAAPAVPDKPKAGSGSRRVPPGGKSATVAVGDDTDAVLGDDTRDEDLGRIHRLIATNLDKLKERLISAPSAAGVSQPSAGVHRSHYDMLTDALLELGAPPEHKPSGTTPEGTAAASSRWPLARPASGVFDSPTAAHVAQEYLATNVKRSTQTVEKAGVFYLKGRAKDKGKVVYLIARRFRKGSLDTESFLLHVLRTLSPIWKDPFTLVLDATDFTADNALPKPLLVKLSKLLPPIARRRLTRIVIVQPSNMFRKYYRTALRWFGPSLLHDDRTVWAASATGIYEWIARADNYLPAETRDVENDIRGTFPGCGKFTSYNRTSEVTLRVSKDSFQVLSNSRIAPSKTAVVTDLIPLSSVEDAKLDSSRGDGVFYVKIRGAKPALFKSKKADEILQAIWASKAKIKITDGQAGDAEERGLLSAADLPGTFLNLAFINLGSSSNQLRLAAYNLLTAVSSVFNFGLNLHEASGLSIPRNSEPFVLETSAALAKSQQSLTLDFLRDAVDGYDASPSPIKHLVLAYTEPWLHNLVLFERGNPIQVERVQALLSSLIELTNKEKDLFRVALHRLWAPFAEQADMHDLLLDQFVTQSRDAGPQSSLAETIAEVTVTIAAKNPQAVSAALVERLLNAFAGVAKSHAAVLEDATEWADMQVLVRMLRMLAYDNLLHLENHGPELFHFVAQSFGLGTYRMREEVHALLVNALHALATKVITHPNQVAQLKNVLTTLSTPKFKFLLLGHGYDGGQDEVADWALGLTPFPGQHAFSMDRVPERTDVEHMEPVVDIMMDVMSLVTKPARPFSANWHQKWLDLTSSVMFVPNQPLQARALMTFASIHPTPVPTKTMHKVMNVARALLVEDNKGNCGLNTPSGMETMLAVLRCLRSLVPDAVRESALSPQLFWIAIGALNMNEPRVYPAALELMASCVEEMALHGKFKAGGGFVRTLTTARSKSGLGEALTEMDKVTGLPFRGHFSFALAALLLRGLKVQPARATAVALLENIVDILMKETAYSSEILPYMTVLVPSVSGETLRTVRALVPPVADLSFFWSKAMVPSQDVALLQVGLLAGMLQEAELGQQQIVLYELFDEGLRTWPHVMPAVYSVLLPKLRSVLHNSRNQSLVTLALHIMGSILGSSEGAASPLVSRQRPRRLSNATAMSRARQAHPVVPGATPGKPAVKAVPAVPAVPSVSPAPTGGAPAPPPSLAAQSKPNVPLPPQGLIRRAEPDRTPLMALHTNSFRERGFLGLLTAGRFEPHDEVVAARVRKVRRAVASALEAIIGGPIAFDTPPPARHSTLHTGEVYHIAEKFGKVSPAISPHTSPRNSPTRGRSRKSNPRGGRSVPAPTPAPPPSSAKKKKSPPKRG